MVDPTQVMSYVTCYQQAFLKSIDSHLKSPHPNVKIFIFCSTESFSPVHLKSMRAVNLLDIYLL
jgi:hypothetical protein